MIGTRNKGGPHGVYPRTGIRPSLLTTRKVGWAGAKRRPTFFYCRLLTNYLLAAAAVLPGVLGGCANAPTGGIRPHRPIASTRYRVGFDSIVNVAYTHRKPLLGWAGTSLVIEKTLAQWYPRLDVRGKYRDPSPRDLKGALNALPTPREADISIVYLASSQTADGRLEFTRTKRKVSWADLLKSVEPHTHPGRLVILDTCGASEALKSKAWRERLAPSALLASTVGERTYELNFRRRLPLDLPGRFAQAHAWLKANMPADWDGRISFLGFIWLQAFLKTDRAPETRADWLEFIRLCTKQAKDFRTRQSRKLASTVHGYASADMPE